MSIELIVGIASVAVSVFGAALWSYIDIRVRLAKIEQKLEDLQELRESWREFIRLVKEE